MFRSEDLFQAALCVFFIISLGITCWQCIRSEKTWTTPLSIFCLWVFVSIVIDGAYTLLSGGTTVLEAEPQEYAIASLSYTLCLWFVAVVSFAGGYWFVTRSANEPSDQQPRVLARPPKTLISLTLFASLVCSLGALYLLIGRGSSLGFSILQLATVRNQITSDGGGFLLALLQIYSYAVLLAFYFAFGNPNANKKLLIAQCLLAAVFDLLIGSRSALFNGFFMPLIIGYSILEKRINLVRLIVPVVLCIIIISPLYRSLTRDVYFEKNRDKTKTEVLIGNFQDIPRMLFGGAEISSLDATMDVISKFDGSNYVYGSTFTDAIQAMLPRSWFPDKPYGGASTYYTTTYYPANYASSRSELLTTFTGELYMNFGFVCVPLGYFLLGALMGSIYCQIFNRKSFPSPIYVLLYAVLMMRLFNLLRGDLFNFISQLLINLIPLLLVLFLLKFLQLFDPRVFYPSITVPEKGQARSPLSPLMKTK